MLCKHKQRFNQTNSGIFWTAYYFEPETVYNTWNHRFVFINKISCPQVSPQLSGIQSVPFVQYKELFDRTVKITPHSVRGSPGESTGDLDYHCNDFAQRRWSNDQ